jgi:cytochrome c556
MRYVALALVLVAAGCGGTAKPKSAPAAKTCPKAQHALARLRADVAAIRKAARTTPEDSPQINAATDRFIADVSTAPIGNLKRNRMIDHAMGALLGQCESCFQALEAGRPIVSIHYPSSGSCS